MCMPPYLLLPNGWQNRLLFSLHPSLLQKSLHSGGLQLPSPPRGLKRYFRPPWGESISLGHLLWPPPPQWPWHTHPSPSLLWESLFPWQLLCSLLSCSFLLLGGATGPGFWPSTNSSIYPSPVFRPNERPPSFNFQKARWDGFASYFDSHCSSAEEYLSLSLSSAAALFTSLTLDAAKSWIPFGRIKCPPKAWWFAEVEEAISERRKAFAAAHRSDEDRQAYITASRRASSVIAKAKTEHGRRLALLSHLSLSLNLYTLSFALSLALLPPLLTFLTGLLPGNRLRSMPPTWDLPFPFLSQRLPLWGLPSHVLGEVSLVLLLSFLTC